MDRGRDGAHSSALEGPRVEVDGGMGTSIVSAHSVIKIQGDNFKSKRNVQKLSRNMLFQGMIIAVIYPISLP